ncbi:hypothetical protein [uncultured Nonlabens sp.]|uniref:hypothetical protein n=1 Tax=uncultured Nonlabens sp. TaxID=859306 RepID=UPI002616B9E8|nr:hypothetical protein [uncultured Nonlabens sp.]
MKYLLFLFILFAFISCEEKIDNKQLPYGYYEDNHWEDLKSYNLNGKVKSRDSYCLEVYDYPRSLTLKDSIPKKYYSIKFNDKGYLTYRKGNNWPIEIDTTITIFKYHYPESFETVNLGIIESGNKKKVFTWDELDRITAIKYFDNKQDSIPTSIKRFEYLKETKFKTKDSDHEGDNSITSYISFNFDEEQKFIGWEQYWGNPLRLAESLQINYDKNHIPVSTIRYEKFYDSVLPTTFKSKLYLNKKKQEVDHVFYNKDSTAILKKFVFKYNEYDRLIFKEYRDNESKRFEINEYNYENDLLRSEKYTRWEPARDTVITKTLFKYDNQNNCIEELHYLNNQLFSRIEHKLKYFKN